MELAGFLDPTTLCVGLLVLAVCLLWAYVMFTGKRKEPNFSVLYETDSSGPKAGKKQVKGKGKKQGDASPKVAASPRETTVSGTAAAAPVPKKQKQQPVPASPKTIVTPSVGSKGKGRKDTPSKGSEEEVVKEQNEGSEAGEWQTQLSRQQLRALRQKRQQEVDKAESTEPVKPERKQEVDKAESTEPVKPERKTSPNGEQKASTSMEEQKPSTTKVQEPAATSGNTGKQADESKAAAPTATNKGNSGRRSKGKKQRGETQRATEKSSEPESVAKNTTQTGEEPAASVPSTSAASEPTSADQRLPTPPAVSEDEPLTKVEKDLLEAAQSSSPTPESQEDGKKVNPKRRKKPNKSPSPDTTAGGDDDDWLVIDLDAPEAPQ